MSRQRTGAHAAFARGQEENWSVIDDAQKRKRVQNRLAQRSYRYKVRERLQELDQLKTAGRSNGDGSLDGTSTQAATRVKTSATSPTIAPLAISMPSESSDLSESAHFMSGFSNSPFPSSASPDQLGDDASGIDHFLANLCPNDSTEPDSLAKCAVGNPQLWTPPASVSEPADYGFDLLGPLNPPTTSTQQAELRFTELMLKIRDVGFEDMESMILEYYSTQFRRESLPYWLQRRSRQQNLCKLLDQLYLHSCSWPAEECASFQDGIKSIAKRALSNDYSNSDAALLTFPFPMGNGLA